MQKIIRNNTDKGFEVVSLPNNYKGVENVVGGYVNRTDLHPLDGFYTIVYPSLTDNQKYGKISVNDLNDETMEVVYPIVDIPILAPPAPPTVQDIYNSKMQEFDAINDSFIDKLVKANYEDVILGETTEEFKGLIRQMKAVKLRVKTDLENFLNTDDKDSLANFNFSTEEAEYLNNEIIKIRNK